jgi:hypothetical protein
VLDNIQRRAFFIQPAREKPPPDPIGLLDIDLDKRAGEFFLLPRRCVLTGAQPHNDVAQADRLPRFQRQFSRNAIAFVQQAKHGDALRHWRGALGLIDIGCCVDRHHVRRCRNLIKDGRARRLDRCGIVRGSAKIGNSRPQQNGKQNRPAPGEKPRS